MQKYRFEIWLADVYRADLNAALVGFGNDRRQHVFGFGADDRDFVIHGFGLLHAVYAFERGGQRFGVVVLADVQDECIGLADLAGEFFLRAEGDQFAVVNDADTVREFLCFFYLCVV